MKVRIHAIAITADIDVSDKHRDFLRFLYVMMTFSKRTQKSFMLVYVGYSLEPLVLSCSQGQFIKYEKVDPEFARKIRKHFYVDLQKGCNTTLVSQA